MLKKLLAFTCLTLSLGANSATLTFDDIPGGSVQNSVGNIFFYGGFDFTPTLDWIDVEGAGTPWLHGAVSGDFAMLNNNGGAGFVTASDNADFTFDGLWAKLWETPPESGGADGLFGTLAGYNNGSEVWSVSTSLNGSYEFYAAQTGAIDTLQLNLGNFFLVDNLSLNGVSDVPLPAAAWLFGSALLGLGALKRKKA